VEGLGPTYFGNADQIYWRANKIFKKEEQFYGLMFLQILFGCSPNLAL
jgi:hypothetical protein